MTRRDFLLGGAGAAGGVAAGWFGAGLVSYMGATPDTPWKAFTPAEAAQVEELCEELIPADPPAPWNGMKGFPGAREAKVVRFIDWQVAPGAPLEHELGSYRKHLPLVKGMSAAEIEKRYRPFFDMVLRHARMGFYGNPCHGGNAGWASYRMLGLAGPAFAGRNIPGKENHL